MSDSNKIDFKALIALVQPYKGTLALATFALFIGTGLGLLYPQLVRILVDGALAEDGSDQNLNQNIMILVGIFGVQSIFTFMRSYLFTVVGERVVADLRMRLYNTLVLQEIAFFDEHRTGELTNRLASDTTVLQNTVTANISMALRFGLQAIGGVIILFVTSVKLTLVMMAVVPVVAISGAVYGRSIRDLSKKVQDSLAKATEVAEETFSGIRTVRSFAREVGEQGRYAAKVEDSYELAVKRSRSTALFGAVISFGGYASIALVIWYGGHLVLEGDLSIGTLTAFILYTFVVAFSLATLSSLYGDFMKAVGSSERVFELVRRESTVGQAENAQSPKDIKGHVVIDNLNFAYPARLDHCVLESVSLEIRPGDQVALVGPSGSGKSTIASLMMRFYDPTQGQIQMDGVSLQDLDLNWLRTQVGAVFQEPVLFATTIADNIRYGRPDASDAEVEEAAQAANAYDFIKNFPEGFKTSVGERGVKLSGGQKQRVAIARAILKDPAVLILDEATSALDAESEHLVQEALERLMQGRTTLIIAHRLSTVIGADRIVVLNEGKVVEQGNHSELMQTGGLYHTLVERQFAGDVAR